MLRFILATACLQISFARAASTAMSWPEALAYLDQHRDRVAVDPKFEKRLTAWAYEGLAAAVLAPSLGVLPETLVDFGRRRHGLGPLHPGSNHLYVFSLVGAIGAVFLAKSVYDLARLSPHIYDRARRPVSYDSRASLNRFLDLPPDVRIRRLTENPRGAAWIVELAQFLRMHPDQTLADDPSILAHGAASAR